MDHPACSEPGCGRPSGGERFGRPWCESHAPLYDSVERPKHYAAGGIQPIDVIEAWGLGFCLGNLVKYVARAGKKEGASELEDLRKARWFLDRQIKKLEGQK